MKKGQYFSMAKSSDIKAKIDIYGDIVNEDWRWDNDTSAVSFRNALQELGDVSELDIYINSGGGDVFEATAIYNMIKRHPAKVHVHIDGLAASAASVIAMAGDTITMPSNSMLMIHNAWSIYMGNHNDLRKYADDLEKLNNSTVKQSYLDKSPGIDPDTLTALMDAETWLTAAEAKEHGLVDEVTGAVNVAASITKDQMERYNKVPEALVEEGKPEPQEDPIKALAKQIEDLSNRVNSLQPHTEPAKEPDPEPQNSVREFFFNLGN